ncbi:hypothetical protein WMY93_021836 [Mugilogobius chulae]|uniref:Uncharacterized protein n=1 Tax=Mugilogobius chulae TaxID=88201 RepID=A0AAW0NG41_9GOBI
MSPERIHHQTFIDLNPTTGVIVRANKRAQVNILTNKIGGFVKTRTLNETIVPVMFINESVVIDEASAARVHKLLLIVTLVSNFPLIIVALGALCLLYSSSSWSALANRRLLLKMKLHTLLSVEKKRKILKMAPTLV